MKADAQTEAEIKALVEDVWEEYARKDLEACTGLWTTDADLVAIGTGADELRLGPEELRRGLRRDFEQAENIKRAIEWLSISAAGKVAWSAANARLTATVNGEATTIACRMTNVYEKRNGTWRIMLLHLSLPAAEQESGHSWPKP
ncbi:MAG: nuclear transport factor 2 family protein [Halobacteriota archaeon]